MGGRPDDDSDKYINIRDQATLSLVGNFSDAAISFLGLVLFANVLGAEGLGKFYVVLAVVKVCLFPIEGIGHSVMKRGSERELDPSVFLGGGLLYGIAYAVLMGTVVASVVLVDSSLLKYSPEVILGAFAVLASRILYKLFLNGYRSQGKTGFATLTDNVHGIIETGAQAAFLLTGYGVTGLLAGTALTTILVSAALLALSRITVACPTFETLRSIARFGRWSVLTSGLGTVYDRLPVIVLSVLFGDYAAGYYTSAMRLLMIGGFVGGGSIAPALMVRVSASTPESNRINDLMMSLQYAGILAIPIMFGSFAIPDALMVTLFGPTFASTGPILATLSLFHVINTYDTVIYSFFEGINRPDLVTKSNAIALFVRVLFILVLIIPFGIMGVVIAVVASHLVHYITSVGVLYEKHNKIVFPRAVGKQVLAGVTMLIVISIVSSSATIPDWQSLLLIVGFGAAIYISLLATFDKELRNIVKDMLYDSVKS